MIHTLLVIAAIIFVVWLVLLLIGHVGGFINLLWIVILVALIWWLLSFITGRRRTPL